MNTLNTRCARRLRASAERVCACRGVGLAGLAVESVRKWPYAVPGVLGPARPPPDIYIYI
jgi:hypothetical protein